MLKLISIERAFHADHFSCKNLGLKINISPSRKDFRFDDITGPNLDKIGLDVITPRQKGLKTPKFALQSFLWC